MYSVDRIVGESVEVKGLKSLLRRVAAGPASTVLLTGESGTGKDLAAKVIHYNSNRASAPFMNITCSAVPEHLLESELFGHERGAFTDARQQKRGLLESADGGTVFLDEIGDMMPVLQAKLLRFLEERTFRRVGGAVDIRVNVRVIAATNRDLERAATEGKFREDLYYRLSVLPVHLRPLREHPSDIPLLLAYYVDAFNREFGRSVREITREAMTALQTYGWPGNIREVRNAVERAMLLTDGDLLTCEHFPFVTPRRRFRRIELPSDGLNLEQLEDDLVAQAIERADGNLTRAAALLGLNRHQIRYRLKKVGVLANHRPRATPGIAEVPG
jgi:two-component system, NtrC family, response regulator AtoC